MIYPWLLWVKILKFFLPPIARARLGMGESGLNTNKTSSLALVFIVVLLFSYFAFRNPTNFVKAPAVPTFNHAIVDATDYANAVCIGDINRDGFSDVIAAQSGVGLFWYKYSNWENYTIASCDWESEEVRCADINRDGYLDVVGAESNVVGAESNHNIYWYENPLPNGDPTKPWTKHYIGTCSWYVWGGLEVADLNNDGKLEVVVRSDAYWGLGEIAIFVQGDNASSWNAINRFYVPSHDGLAIGDLNGDSHPDIVLNGYWLENPYPDLSKNWTMHIIDSKWYNQSTGSWRDNNARVAVADLNKDGRLEVLFSQPETTGFPVSWYETSNAETGPWVEHVIGYVDNCHTLLVGDLNNDGYLDVVAAKFSRSDGAIPPPYPIVVFYNNGDCLSWNETVVSDLGMYKGVLGDIGNTGYLDIIGSRGYLVPPIDIWVNSPNSTPTPTPTPTTSPFPLPSSNPISTPTLTVAPTPTSAQTRTPTSTSTPTTKPSPTSPPTSAPSVLRSPFLSQTSTLTATLPPEAFYAIGVITISAIVFIGIKTLKKQKKI